jgi:transcriptional regulator with PAS, ATPase and Fis domain
VAPLRERRGDIEALVWHFIEKLNRDLARNVPVVDVTVQAMEAMRSYAWPGNVRELANAIDSAITFGRSETIRLDDLPEAIAGRPPEALANPLSIPDAERQLVTRSLEANNGNVSASARSLGISRKKLYSRIIRYGLAY